MSILEMKKSFFERIKRINILKRILFTLFFSFLIATGIGYVIYRFTIFNEEYIFNNKTNEINESLNNLLSQYNKDLIDFKNFVSVQPNFNKRDFDKYTDAVLSNPQNNFIYMMDYMVELNESNFQKFYKELKEEYQKDNNYLSKDIEVEINENQTDNEIQKQKSPKNYDVIKYISPQERGYHYIGYDVSTYIPLKENLKEIKSGKNSIPISKRYNEKEKNEFYFFRTFLPIFKNNNYSGSVGISLRLDKALFNNITNHSNYIDYQIYYDTEEGKVLMYDSRYERKNIDESWPKNLLNEVDNKFINETPFKLGNGSFYIKTFSKTYSPSFIGYNFIYLIIFCVFIINIVIIYYTIFKENAYLKISEIEKLRAEKLEVQVNTDELTNIPNRRAFLKYLKNEFAFDENENNIYLFFIDLDGFKRINDNFGHASGDLVLIEYAQRLKSFAKYNDCKYYRIGGDEFILIMKQTEKNKLISTECQVSLLAKNLLQLTNNPFVIEGESFSLTQSIGIAEYSDKNVTPENLFKNADIAMYEAKRKGKNNYLFFSKELFEKIEKTNQILNFLENAIEKEEFSLSFQPKMKKFNGKYIIKSMEALIRWNNPKLGNVSPAIFIPLAEESGLINKIGHWVIEEIAKMMNDWKKHIILRDLTVSINLSVKQLNNSSLPESFYNILRKYDINPNQLIIEITESAMMLEPNKTKEVLLKFREYGFKISVDDFGTGHSSLSYLRQFPVNEIKIDKSFTDEILTDEQDKIIVEGIISMAKKLQLNVVIEGVETKEQVFCLENNYDNNGEIEIQGYYFSKPLTNKDLKTYVEKL